MHLIAWILIAPISVALAVIDIRTFRLPNRLVGLAYLIGVALFLFDFEKFRISLLFSFLLLVSYFILHLLSRGGLGMGDVKLAAVVGLFAGNISGAAVLIATWLAFLTGGVVALIGIFSGRISARSHLPFGPFMLLGLWLAPVVLGI